MAISTIAQQAATRPQKGPSCTVCRALAELPKADAEGLLALLSDPSWRYTAIASLIYEDEDTPQWVREIHHKTYARHATGDCSARKRLR